jgi:translation initiation factor 4G
LNTGASAFVPKRITIKSEDGREVDIENWRKRERDLSSAPPIASPVTRSNAVRMETVEAKTKRLAEEEKERIQKAAAAEEAKKAAEEEKRRKEEEEKEKQRQEEEAEKERIRKEEEKKRREQEEKEKEEARLKMEEDERLKKEEEVRLQKEAEERRLEEEAQASLLKDEQVEPEEGELIENEPSPDEQTAKADQAAQLRREALRIDTSIALDAKRRPGPLDLSSTAKAVVSPPQPSALASARIIEDLGNVPYPDGIMSPRVELNVNAKKGKFR